MKSVLRLIVLVAGHILAVLLLARVVRNPLGSLDLDFRVAIAYGIPAVSVFVACLVFVRPLRNGFFRIVVAALVVSAGHVVSLMVLQKTDMWLTARYIQQMQPRLQADSRFKDVRLICYSNDFVLSPYIPVGGSVASEEDLRELNRLLRESDPPAFAGAGSHLIRRPAKEDGF